MFTYIVCSIWPIEMTLSGAPNPGDSERGSNSNKRILRILKSPRLQLRYQIVLCHMQDTRWWGLTPLLRCSLCILLGWIIHKRHLKNTVIFLFWVVSCTFFKEINCDASFHVAEKLTAWSFSMTAAPRSVCFFFLTGELVGFPSMTRCCKHMFSKSVLFFFFFFFLQKQASTYTVNIFR